MSEAAAASPPTSEPVSTRRALAFVYVGYAFRYLYLFILVPFYGRVLGAAEYGRVLAAMSLFQIVWLVAEYGFPPVGARDAAATSNQNELAHIYGRHVSGRLLTALPAAAIGLFGTLLSPLLREQPVFGVLATLTGLMAAFNLGWFFQGTLRFRTSTLLEMAGFAINLPLILFLVRGPNDGWRVLAIIFTSSLIATVAAHAIAIKSLGGARIRFAGGRAVVSDSTALFAHKGLILLMANSSTYLVSLFASAAEVGYYGAAERLISAALSLMNPANQVLIGTVSKHIATRDGEERAYGLMRTGFLAFSALGVVMLAGTLLLSSTLVPLILGPSFVPSIPMLHVLALIFPFAAIDQVVTGYVLIPLRLDRVVTKVSFQSAVITVLLVLALGRSFGGLGVSWARSLGAALMAGNLLFTLRNRQLLQRIFG
ncbi:MAG: lipopolysaccharide biosynthesis protein [Myxococcota bacterium]